MSGKTGVALLKEYFTDPKLELAELKALSKEERVELADAVASELGLKKVGGPNNVTYV